MPTSQADTAPKFALVASRFNATIVDILVAGARETLLQRGVAAGQIELYHAPGALELPLLAQAVALKLRPSAIIACGCVIRGQSRHFEIVADQSAAGLQRVALDLQMPVFNAVLACDSTEQALARAGGDHGNKGVEAALAALDLLAVLRTLDHV